MPHAPPFTVKGFMFFRKSRGTENYKGYETAKAAICDTTSYLEMELLEGKLISRGLIQTWAPNDSLTDTQEED